MIALPLHPARLAERGFNQSVEIGRFLARQWGLPLLLDACVKDRLVEPQARLPWKARRNNIRRGVSLRRRPERQAHRWWFTTS